MLDQVQIASQQQTVNISAKLIASIKVLQYSSEELEQAVAQELIENPALELEEVVQCNRCGATLTAGLCPNCERNGDQTTDGRDDLASWDDYRELRGTTSPASDEDTYNPLDFVRSGGTLQEFLMRQLGASLSADDYPIVEYLIGSLDSHGYVTVSVEEAAETLRVPVERIELALSALQALDPPGIGARDLRECLLIQLRVFEERDETPPLARQLILDYLRTLGEHRFADIAREMGVSSTEIKRVWQFIRANLNPYPAHAFESGDVPGLALGAGAERSVIVRPDVVIRRTEQGGFEAEVVERRRFRFGMNSVYRSLYLQARMQRNGYDSLDESDKQHIRHCQCLDRSPAGVPRQRHSLPQAAHPRRARGLCGPARVHRQPRHGEQVCIAA
jgi:RNA polymerase sigma-54 factor